MTEKTSNQNETRQFINSKCLEFCRIENFVDLDNQQMGKDNESLYTPISENENLNILNKRNSLEHNIFDLELSAIQMDKDNTNYIELPFNNSFLYSPQEKSESNYHVINEYLYDILKGNFVNFIQTNPGSKFLQNAIKRTEMKYISNIFSEIREKLPELIINKYGNHFCKVLYTSLCLQDKIQFIKVLKFSFTNIALNAYGSLSLVSMIENMTNNEEFDVLMDAVSSSVTLANLIKFPKSKFVVDKIIKHMPTKNLIPILDFVNRKFKILSLNSNTVNIIIELLAKPNDGTITKNLIKIIESNFFEFIYHQNGSKIIQFTIQFFNFELNKCIYRQFLGNFCKIASNRYSSVVLGKAFEKCDQFFIFYFTAEIIEKKQMGILLSNQFGVQIIHQFFQSALPSLKQSFINSILYFVNFFNDLNFKEYIKKLCYYQLRQIPKQA